MTMPVSVEVHHALVDGLQVSRFLDVFQEDLEQPEKLLIADPSDIDR
jgi:chloramphenicol O-acetyltransferase